MTGLRCRNAVDAASGDDGWAHRHTSAARSANQTSLEARNYGYPKLSELIEATQLFEEKRQNQIVLIQDNRRA